MGQDINSVTITGRLTADAELKTAGGQPVLNMSIANNKGKKKQGDAWVEQEANFFRVIIWGRTAEALKQYLVKGKQVAVSGKLTQRSYQLPEETKKRSVCEIVAFTVQLLGGGQQTAPASDVPYVPDVADSYPAEFDPDREGLDS